MSKPQVQMTTGLMLVFTLWTGWVGVAADRVEPRQADGDGAVTVSGELKQWHPVTLTLNGPFAHERDTKSNPFMDARLTVTFEHESGSPVYQVPGYFAADGRAGETSAESGTQWRAHLSPDKIGVWTYIVSFVQGVGAAIDLAAGEKLAPFDGKTGRFEIGASDKTGRDFRGKGRLQYVGKHHLRFAGSGEYFLKAGPDAPETLLAYVDFDGTEARKKNVPLKTWERHVQDWQAGDPTWKEDRGKGLIGALNYLSGKGCNAFSFLTYNAGGDGDNVWPFVERDMKFHYDCSKLDQWKVVFNHAQLRGLYLHFKMQETENDDNRHGKSKDPVMTSLDGGDLGPERKLYVRELIARFGDALALNWNLGEENTQTPEQQRAMAQYIHDLDPYHHSIVIHTFPNEQEKVYSKLTGDQSVLTGASLQNMWDDVHRRTLQWVSASTQAGRPWVVANDEQGSAGTGVPPDEGYEGFDGVVKNKKDDQVYTRHDVRKLTLWGNLMAGGAGVEYYFGYSLKQNDLLCEDYRSRDKSWDSCRVALSFFHDQAIPFQDMANANARVGNAKNENTVFCLAKAGALYLVYLTQGGQATLDLKDQSGKFEVRWFNPRSGGMLQKGSVDQIEAPANASLGSAPSDPTEDWLVVVRAVR